MMCLGSLSSSLPPPSFTQTMNSLQNGHHGAEPCDHARLRGGHSSHPRDFVIWGILGELCYVGYRRGYRLS